MKQSHILGLLFSIGLVLPQISLAQKEAAIWYFGNNAGLDFNFSPPKPISNPKMNTSEGCSSISDTQGNLLFYTDGSTVWNKLHDSMENGNNLFGHSSSTHSSIVLKKPNSLNEYYLITADIWILGNRGVNYSVIDLSYNNGLGKVTAKNIPLVASSGEKIAVTSHSNRKDAWVAISECNTNNLHLFLVSEHGFELKATYTNLFPIPQSCFGQIKFSPDARFLALLLSTSINIQEKSVAILEFNDLTGLINPSQIISGGTNLYGIEFSPNSKYLYLSSWITLQNKVCQCPVIPGNTNFLTDCKFYPQVGRSGQLQLGPDQKIYIANGSKQYVGVIEFPDSDFVKSGFMDSAIGLLPNTRCGYGLPSFNTAYLSSPPINVLNLCVGDTTRFSVDTSNLVYDSLSWLINKHRIFETRTSGSFVFTQTGTSQIGVVVYSGINRDTIVRWVNILPLPLRPDFPDTSVCTGQLMTFNAAREADAQYQWNTGGADSVLTAIQSGLYVVKLTKNGCAVTDSFQLSYHPYPSINIPDEITICQGASFTTNTPSHNHSYLWSTGDTTSSVILNNEGYFWVAVTKDYCTSTDTFSLHISTLPVANLGPDTGICENQSLTFNTTHPYSQYLWNTGSSDPVFRITKAGLYSVKIENPCGAVYDSILISQEVCNCQVWTPNAFSPNGDLNNDLFIPALSCDHTGFDFRIYSRWGEEVFHSSSVLNAWDGSYKGVPAPIDVYFWKLTYTLSNTAGQIFTYNNSGTVTLLR